MQTAGTKKLLEMLIKEQHPGKTPLADLANRSGIVKEINIDDAANMLRAVGELREAATTDQLVGYWRELK